MSNKKRRERLKHTDQVYPRMFEYERNQDDVYFDLIRLIELTI